MNSKYVLKLKYPILDDHPTAIRMTNSGKTFIAAHRGGSIVMRGVNNYGNLTLHSGERTLMTDLVFRPNYPHLFVTSFEQKMVLLDLGKQTKIRTFSGYNKAVINCSVNPDGNQVLTASEDSRVKLWDLRTYRSIKTFCANRVTSVEFAPSGDAFVYSHLTGFFTVRDSRSYNRISYSVGKQISPITAVKYFGEDYICTAQNGAFKFWNSDDGRMAAKVGTPRYSPPFCITHSGFDFAEEQYLLIGCENHELTVWDLTNGVKIQTITAHEDSVLCVRGHPEKNIIVTTTGKKDKYIRVWERRKIKKKQQ